MTLPSFDVVHVFLVNIAISSIVLDIDFDLNLYGVHDGLEVAVLEPELDFVLLYAIQPQVIFIYDNKFIRLLVKGEVTRHAEKLNRVVYTQVSVEDYRR